MLATGAGREPRRTSVAYTVALAFHLVVLVVASVRITRHTLYTTHSASAPAVHLSLPAAPRVPVADKTAPTLRHQSVGAMQPRKTAAPLQQPVIADAPRMATSSPSILPAMLAAQPRVSVASAPAGASGRGTQKGESLPAASEAAAPKSYASSEGNLSGAKTSWEGQILAHLSRFRRYPSSARMRREEGVVYIRFRIDRAGRLLAVSLDRSSGSTALDKEALATVSRAQPLPAIPQAIPDPAEMSIPIEFFLR
jgi:protein TonB